MRLMPPLSTTPLPPQQPDPAAERIVVVGGGAAAVIAVVHLFRVATRPLDVHVVERSGTVGPGLAYRTPHPRHTVNNFAERLSAVEGDPHHLIRWCAARGLDLGARSFPSRRLYGEYLTATLDAVEVPAGSVLRRTHGEALDLRRDGGEWSVDLREGWSVPADRVVLALGNPPPRDLPTYAGLGEAYVADPWAVDLERLATGARRVLLIGTGLTMVDVAAQVHQIAPHAELTAVSRHGLLPTAHVAEPTDGSTWRDAVDAVRAHANRLWASLSEDDQARFASEYARRWDVVRHRMSPAMAHHVAGLQRSGTLVLRRPEDVQPESFDLVVNCTGFRPFASRGWSPLVDALLDEGTIQPDRLGLGVEAVQPGHPVDADGRVRDDLHLLGAARKGLEWEVTAVPDLRSQAVSLAEDVAARPCRVNA